jgi:hypothetical protein
MFDFVIFNNGSETVRLRSASSNINDAFGFGQRSTESPRPWP